MFRGQAGAGYSDEEEGATKSRSFQANYLNIVRYSAENAAVSSRCGESSIAKADERTFAIPDRSAPDPGIGASARVAHTATTPMAPARNSI